MQRWVWQGKVGRQIVVLADKRHKVSRIHVMAAANACRWQMLIGHRQHEEFPGCVIASRAEGDAQWQAACKGQRMTARETAMMLCRVHPTRSDDVHL